MNNQIITMYIIVIGLSIVIGAFKELPEKQYGFFIGRIVFSAIVSVIMNLILYHNII